MGVGVVWGRGGNKPLPPVRIPAAGGISAAAIQLSHTTVSRCWVWLVLKCPDAEWIQLQWDEKCRWRIETEWLQMWAGLDWDRGRHVHVGGSSTDWRCHGGTGSVGGKQK